jgi:hypothetical protein
VCGEAEEGIEDRVHGAVPVVSLVGRFGRDVATADAASCLREVAATLAAQVEGPDGG